MRSLRLCVRWLQNGKERKKEKRGFPPRGIHHKSLCHPFFFFFFACLSLNELISKELTGEVVNEEGGVGSLNCGWLLSLKCVDAYHMCPRQQYRLHHRAPARKKKKKGDVVIIKLLTQEKKRLPSVTTNTSFYKNELGQLLQVEVSQIAALASGERSNDATPHCNPASLREFAIKTLKLPVSPKHRMLPSSRQVRASAVLTRAQ